MLDIATVQAILEPYAEAIGPEGMAEIQVSLVEKDTAVQDTETLEVSLVEKDTAVQDTETLAGQLEEERKGRAADREAYEQKLAEFNARVSRFIKGEDPGGDEEDETPPPADDTEEEQEDFYSRYMKGE